MTSHELAKRLRAFLIRVEKGTARLLSYEFALLRAEVIELLARILPENPTLAFEIEELLEEIEKKIAKRTVRFGSIVGDSQRKVIKFTADTLVRYNKIFESDLEAAAKIAGRAQNGQSLSVFFKRLEPLFANAAKEQLIEGFTLGESAKKIARRIDQVTDIGKTRAMTIARTETNEAFRAASRDMYTGSGVKKYVWVAVLDARTCLRCWNLHGQIFPTEKKVFSHPNCRCVLIPFITGEKIEPGEARFAKLEPGFQKQILGPARFDLYESGSKLSNFVGYSESEEEGRQYFIRPLDELE